METLRADLSVGPQQILSFLHIHFKWFGPGSYNFPIEFPHAELTLPDREVLEISESDEDTETGREAGQKIHDDALEDTGTVNNSKKFQLLSNIQLKSSDRAKDIWRMMTVKTLWRMLRLQLYCSTTLLSDLQTDTEPSSVCANLQQLLTFPSLTAPVDNYRGTKVLFYASLSELSLDILITILFLLCYTKL